MAAPHVQLIVHQVGAGHERCDRGQAVGLVRPGRCQDVLPVHDGRRGDGRAADAFGLGRYRDRLGDAGHLELNVNDGRRVRNDGDQLLRRLEPLDGNRQHIVADRNRGKLKIALRTRRRRLRQIRIPRLEHNRDAGHGPMLRIVHDALHAPEDDGECRRRGRHAHRRHDTASNKTAHIPSSIRNVHTEAPRDNRPVVHRCGTSAPRRLARD